jgi:plastocyanin
MNALLFAIVLAAAGPVLSPSATLGMNSVEGISTVHIKNFAFDPATLTVAAGTTVRFVNDDSEAHTVTARDGSFNSNGLDTNDSWSFRFTKPGDYPYFCQLHPYMKGEVVVK